MRFMRCTHVAIEIDQIPLEAKKKNERERGPRNKKYIDTFNIFMSGDHRL